MGGVTVRKVFVLSYDLLWVAVSPFLALTLRHDLHLPINQSYQLISYAGFLVAIAALVFVIAGLHRHLWHAATFADLLRIMIAVSAVLAVALALTFTVNRLESLPRSVPIIQWILLVGGIAAGRVLARFLRERKAGLRVTHGPSRAQRHVLLVGVNRLAQLYVRSIDALGSHGTIRVEGILTDDKRLHGRTTEGYPVLGAAYDVARVVDQFFVHGVIIERVVVAEPWDALSPKSRDAILQLRWTSDIALDFLPERLVDGEPTAMISNGGSTIDHGQPQSQPGPAVTPFSNTGTSTVGGGWLKRAFDIALSAVLIVLLAPIGLLVAILVAWDVGSPLLFWQQRPGRFGVPFRLYKFRTMRGAYDHRGRRIADDKRTSVVGAFLRRVRLDEIPQLFNIFFGQMSFVGPRPLLPADQPRNADLRLQVRPGLTGWAQVSGGRLLDVDPELKSALDIWYGRNVSLRLDLEILLRTVGVVVRGERWRQQAVDWALAGGQYREDAQEVASPQHGAEPAVHDGGRVRPASSEAA
jgi:lipopolysaccharide/colanic/teichoic acid biosynthesis glycosyltransferase